MTPLEYCRQLVDVPGSSLHYALVFLSAGDQALLLPLLALGHELQAIVIGVSDPSVAQAKLAWWQTELAHLGTPEVSHPVCQALALCPPREGQIAPLFDATLIDLTQTRHLDFAGLEAYCRSGAGSLARLCGERLGIESAAALDAACELGGALRLSQIFLNIGADARRGRVYVPIDLLQEHGVTASAIVQAKSGPAFATLSAALCKRVRSQLHDALSGLAPDSRRRLRPLIILAAIQMRLLDEIDRNGSSLLEERVDLTPLRKFLIAWLVWVGLWRAR